MKTMLLTLLLAVFTLQAATAQSLNKYRWKSRLVLAFTPSPQDPNFERQMQLLYAERDAFQERDVVFILVTPNGDFENTGRFLNQADSERLYEQFSAAQYQFELVLVGYDGYEKFRARNRVVAPIVLLDQIDGMPMSRRARRLEGYNNRSNIKQQEPNAPVVKKRRKF